LLHSNGSPKAEAVAAIAFIDDIVIFTWKSAIAWSSAQGWIRSRMRTLSQTKEKGSRY